MTSYKFQIRESGIVQKVQTSGDVYARLTMREMTRRERVRANERMTYARQFLPTMAEKRAFMGRPAHITQAEMRPTAQPCALTRYHNSKEIA